jgi:hypothetical protein
VVNNEPARPTRVVSVTGEDLSGRTVPWAKRLPSLDGGIGSRTTGSTATAARITLFASGRRSRYSNGSIEWLTTIDVTTYDSIRCPPGAMFFWCWRWCTDAGFSDRLELTLSVSPARIFA